MAAAGGSLVSRSMRCGYNIRHSEPVSALYRTLAHTLMLLHPLRTVCACPLRLATRCVPAAAGVATGNTQTNASTPYHTADEPAESSVGDEGSTVSSALTFDDPVRPKDLAVAMQASVLRVPLPTTKGKRHITSRSQHHRDTIATPKVRRSDSLASSVSSSQRSASAPRRQAAVRGRRRRRLSSAMSQASQAVHGGDRRRQLRHLASKMLQKGNAHERKQQRFSAHIADYEGTQSTLHTHPLLTTTSPTCLVTRHTHQAFATELAISLPPQS